MSYQIECGHCGYRFTLDATDPPGTVKCEVCGGTLTVAVATPVSPPAPPPAPPPPPPPPPEPEPELLPPPPAPAAPALGDRPEDRAPYLAPPWPSVRNALDLVHTATGIALVLCVPLLGMGSFVTPVVPPAERRSVEDVLWVLIVAQLVPAGLHLLGQIRCMEKVPESYGRPAIAPSYFLAILSCLSPVWLTAADSPPLAALTFLGLNLAAFGAWLYFLARLGARLRDDEFQVAVRSFVLWFAFGVVQSATLLAWAYIATYAERPLAAGFFRLAASAVGFVIMWRYAALLRVAALAVERRAPVTPRS